MTLMNKHIYYFLYTFYEGYTDVAETESSLRTQAFNCILIEGVDFEKGADIRTINELAWKKAAHDANIYFDFLIEIKLLGVDRGKINV